jgi:predicted amidohydrolase YtcJ
MTAPLLQRAKDAGIVIAFHSYIYEQWEALEAYGDRMIHAYRTALDIGTNIASHSDGEFSKVCAMTRLQSVVTRKGKNGKVYGPEERISVEEAIKIWTLDGAYTSFEENDKGSITPGKLADFIVLRQDPRKVDPDTIMDIVVDATYIGGVNVWQNTQ